MFCYAWNKFDAASQVPIGNTNSPDLLNLLAKVLLNGTKIAITRGLERDYTEFCEDLETVRGKINLSDSIRLKSNNIRKLNCEFDEFTYNTTANQILKSTLLKLLLSDKVEPQIQTEIKPTIFRLPQIETIRIQNRHFVQVKIHRNNSHYSLLMNICELIHNHLLPDEVNHGKKFNSVFEDEKFMARVFEDFVRNFYKVEQQKYKVEPLTLKWDATPINISNIAQLPNMRTDIYLKSENGAIIIDTKFYRNAIQTFYETDTFNSNNLYQLFTYLEHYSSTTGYNHAVNGILLYPTVNFELNEMFLIKGKSISIHTINLQQHWESIKLRLLEIINK